ncbi:MAG: helix-turn-helix transcriptional regulator [Thermomicrobiaceae bacterium]|nr:helix-turn-helix transcriptional regulator [Thermomicrobiaceae bacterium]
MILVATTQSLALKAKLFRGLADPSRLAILEALRPGPRSVGAVVRGTGLSQPNVSNHLACLHDCGLVAREPRGRFVYYRLSDPRVERLLALGDAVLADVATGVYQCTRYEQPEPR